MQRHFALAALVGMAALIFAPELRDAGAYVLSKSLDANADKVIENSLYGLGCFEAAFHPPWWRPDHG